jgi:hypothetical protein
VGFIFFQKNKSEKKEKYWIHNVSSKSRGKGRKNENTGFVMF